MLYCETNKLKLNIMISDKNKNSKEHSYKKNGKCNEQLRDGYLKDIKQEVWIECCEKFFGMRP